MSPALDCSSPAQRSFHANWRNLSNVFGETSAFTVNIVALFVVFFMSQTAFAHDPA
jgi:hypothetical protein